MTLIAISACTPTQVSALPGTTKQQIAGYAGPSVRYPSVAIIPQGTKIKLDGKTGDSWVTTYITGRTVWLQRFFIDIDGNADGLPEVAAPYLEPNDHTAYIAALTQQSRTVVDWSEAGRYLGWNKVICGPVASANYAASSTGSPTILNIGNDYPSTNRFVVIIWGKYRDYFPSPLESFYRGKTICVQGEVGFYEGVYEVEVAYPNDIEVR
jgi:hypothetical protein